MPKPETSGSLAMVWPTSWIFCCAFWKEASCEVSITPLRKPVSCCGKKPVLEVA